jgi:hypothetical protein
MAEHPGRAVAERMLREGGYKAKKRGGKVSGGAAVHRVDRRARGGTIKDDQPDDADGNRDVHSARADGGRVSKKGGKTIININAGGKEGDDAQHDQQVFQQGAQMGARAIAQKLAGAGGGGPPGGAPMGPPRPPGAGGMPPPGMGPGGPPPGPGGPPGLPPRPMMPPPGAPPPGMPMHARGGGLRDGRGRFSGGAV